ncbi:MAG TPA: aminoacyl-histidine dipeptidase [Bacteroidales bacterium]|nr:aminoacyl-histidine dipeptidase [Bacteroidales bacterium]
MALEKLSPKQVWQHFEELCNIPRPSKHEAQAGEYVIAFAQKHSLYCEKDRVGNIVIRKPAAKGKESKPMITLQAHLDMVPQKNSDTVHDFTKDPIKPQIDGEWVKASGTTLGADNGIGVAAALALLESDDVAHGPIEALFTIDEETGMTGAFGLEEGFLKGSVLLNLDSEEFGEIIVGCAGGINTIATFNYFTETVSGDVKAYKLCLTGLKGGHSGVDIHLGRANANKLLNRFMWNAEHFFGMRICSINGGNMRNAIPREAFAEVTIPSNFADDFIKSVQNFQHIYQEEFASVETGLSFAAKEIPTPSTWIDKNTSEKLLDSVYAIPNGIIRMIPEMPDVVETSTNLAIVKSDDANKTIQVVSLLRSSVDSAKKDLCNMVESIFDMAHACTVHEGDYPGWKPDFKAPVLQTMKSVYLSMYGELPQIKVIHAGLECGIIGSLYPTMQMASFGPTIKYPHSPDEKVNIASVENFWNYLVKIVEGV